MGDASAGHAFVRLHRGLTRGAWTARWRVVALASWVGVSLVLLGLLVPRAFLGGRVVTLELSGTAARAAPVLDGVSPASLRVALWWHLPLVAAYVVVLLAGLALFPSRAYRLQGWRSFRRVATLVLGWTAALDVAEHALLLVATPSAAGSDALRIAVATAAWATFLGLALLLASVVNAALVYVLTPRSVQELLVSAADGVVEPSDGPQRLASADAHFRQGICIAGGGVRSAALALGGLQELEAPVVPGRAASQAPPSWDNAERVAAVSGGAYMAGAWSIARSSRRSGPPEPGPGTLPAPWAEGSPEEQHLLTRLGY